MTKYQVEPRITKERGNWCALPLELDLSKPVTRDQELGRVRARRRGEAIKKAVENLGLQPGTFWVIEVVPDSRVIEVTA